jgi:peroxiredoxin
MRAAIALVLSTLALAGCSRDKPSGEAATTPSPTAAEPTGTPPGAVAPPTAPTPSAPAAPPIDHPVVGKPAPDFTLKALDGTEVSLAGVRGKTIVLEWFNPKCPFVMRSHTKGSLVGTAQRHMDTGVVWLAINSAAPGKQGHDPAENAAAVASWGLTHPVLRDETGAVGKAYGATNTPHMFVIDKTGTVVYAGAIDNSPDGEKGSPEGGTLVNHVDAALGALAVGNAVPTPVTKAYGCSVKYGS